MGGRGRRRRRRRKEGRKESDGRKSARERKRETRRRSFCRIPGFGGRSRRTTERLEREREKENGTYFGLEVLCKPVTINSLDQYWSPFVLILMVFFVWCRVLL